MAELVHSVSEKAKVIMCKFEDEFYPKTVLIEAKGTKKAEAKKIAEKVADKLLSK